MKKKTYLLVSSLVTAAAGAAVAVVTYVEPAYAGAINAAIGVVEGAVVTICGLFTVPDEGGK